jgi:hypothetical protein
MKEFATTAFISNKLREQAAILGLTIPFTEEELKSAFRTKVFETHPDHGGTKEEFNKVTEANEYLVPFASQEITEKEIQHIEWQRIKIEEQEPFKNFIDCNHCGGKGRWVATIRIPIYEMEESSSKICHKCGGDGKHKFGCRACNGTGKYTQNSGRVVDCKKCNGTGKFVAGECYTCHGTGRIEVSPWSFIGLFGFTRRIIGYRTESHRTSCGVCHGTGKKEILNPALKKGVVQKGSNSKKEKKKARKAERSQIIGVCKECGRQGIVNNNKLCHSCNTKSQEGGSYNEL